MVMVLWLHILHPLGGKYIGEFCHRFIAPNTSNFHIFLINKSLITNENEEKKKQTNLNST